MRKTKQASCSVLASVAGSKELKLATAPTSKPPAQPTKSRKLSEQDRIALEIQQLRMSNLKLEEALILQPLGPEKIARLGQVLHASNEQQAKLSVMLQRFFVEYDYNPKIDDIDGATGEFKLNAEATKNENEKAKQIASALAAQTASKPSN